MSKLLFNLLNVSFPGRTTAVRHTPIASFGSAGWFWSRTGQPTTIKIMTTNAVTAM
jgi:hypothetical protein